MTTSVVCRVSWGHISGAGFSGRGYQIFKNGSPVTTIRLSQYNAWNAYKRDHRSEYLAERTARPAS